MKFLPTFGAMLLLTFFGAFVFAGFAGILMENIYTWIVLTALISAALICAFTKLSDRIDALEKRIRELEEEKEGRL